MFSLFHNQIFS